MEKKKFKLGLLPKLLIAIVLGIIIGQFFPVWFCRVVVTASSIFSSFLKFVIPLMIVAYVTMGIADLKSGAGKLLLITVALAYGSTLIAGSASYLVSANLFPSFMSEGALEQIAATADNSLASYISISIPPILDTLSAVVLAFVLVVVGAMVFLIGLVRYRTEMQHLNTANRIEALAALAGAGLFPLFTVLRFLHAYTRPGMAVFIVLLAVAVGLWVWRLAVDCKKLQAEKSHPIAEKD